ncbi:ATP-binding protein [Enterococcus faecalis]|uniref:ATP-binding protein n=2 Tax=Enterococcus faecalis TaxID=1351 RepID=UPI001780A532|nr:ATP-binding protein [Enterococcus faecalis]MBD9892287.1 ATP-binding protein [Enterococcus faecalis]MBW4168718.1 ATP-binding protein [Enterococcus faecalis]MBW4173703.1 ATP-binding protein [Enterococcus faecalis]MBW4176592.1 ATP-binding protein [Enterococcus faecalis]MCD4999905.1 ATP-binding protein [Enterococcus faecalis]
MNESNINSSLNFVVGAVREIRGTSVLIRLFENTGQLVHFFHGEKYSGIIIGSYLGIIRGQYTIVGKVEKEYAYDQMKDSTVQEFRKDRFVREIEVKIIGSFKRNEYKSGMVAFPQIFNDVILLSDSQKGKIIGGYESCTDSEDLIIPRISIGKVWPDGIRFNLKWYRLFNSHLAIFGNTGSGKSNTLAKLYHELFKLDFEDQLLDFGESKFVLLDFNGEYIGEKTITNSKKVYNLTTNRNKNNGDKETDYLNIPEERFWDKDMLSVLFGATEQTQQPFLSRVLNYYFEEEGSFQDSLPRYIAEAFSNVYIVSNNNSLDLFKQALKLLELKNEDVSDWIDNTLYNNTNEKFYSKQPLDGWNCSGPYSYWNPDENLLRQEKQKVFSKLNGRTFNVDNPMKNLQIASYLKMIFELRQHTVQYDHIAPLLHRIESRVNDFSKVFKIVGGDKEIFSDTINVVSFKDVNQDMKMLIPMVIAKMTYEMNREQNNNRDRIFNLIIDEAHNILSETSSRESEKWKDYRLEVFEEIIKEGRKFGYFLTVSSQRPADISATIVSQVHNYFIHRLVNDNDLRLLDRTMSSLDSVSKESIPNLAPGQVILTGVLFDLPIILQVDQLQREEAPNSENTPLLDIWKLNENK